MTVREVRLLRATFKQMNWKGAALWVFYTWTQPMSCSINTSLQQFSRAALGVLHLDPAQMLFNQHHPSRITSCAPVSIPSSQTGVTLNVAKGCYIWTQSSSYTISS